MSDKREVLYCGKTQRQIDNFPNDVEEIVKTNLQALQQSNFSSFSDLPDWSNEGSVTDKSLKGKKLEGTHQLTVKFRDSYRVVYVAQHADFIVILHCFKKKTEGKSSKDMRTVESRLRKLNNDIREGKL